MARLKSPKAKGDAYERELATVLDHALFDGASRVYRAPLSGGGRTFSGGGSADLIGLPEVWAEAKRTEKFAPYPAIEQAERGRDGHQSREMPVVFNRKNGMKTLDSLVVMRLSDWLVLYRAYLELTGVTQRKTSSRPGPSSGASYEQADPADRLYEAEQNFIRLNTQELNDGTQDN